MSGLANQSNDNIIWEGECGADPMDDLDLSSLLALSLTPTYSDFNSTYLNRSSAPSVNFQDWVDAEEHIAFGDFIEEEYLDVEPREQEGLKDYVVTESQPSGPSWMKDEACLATGSHKLLATDGHLYRALDQPTRLRSGTTAHRPEQTKPTRRRKKSAQPCSCDETHEETREAPPLPTVPGFQSGETGPAPPLPSQPPRPSSAYSQESQASAYWELRGRVSAYSALRLEQPASGPSVRYPRPADLLWAGGRRRRRPSQLLPCNAAVPPVSLQRDDTDDGERNPDDATHETACDCARWRPGRGARWRGGGTCATAAAPTVGSPEEEAVVNDSEEIVFGVGDRV
ncbi:hypothetical protein DL769_002422 [Monosporascus sp. CRB-8-3]|nr:hypothetical protein DL769_002422 [Monosporascus sp. CRB-8-3]